MNNQSVPEVSMTAAMIGDATVPTIGPITATSPTRSASPNTSAHEIHAIRPSEIPLTNRAPNSIEKDGVRPETRLATMPTIAAISIIRRRGRKKRPAPQLAIMNPASWNVEMIPTVSTSMSNSSATPFTRNGVAVKTMVLTAVAAKTPAGMFGRSVYSSRTGAWSIRCPDASTRVRPRSGCAPGRANPRRRVW